MSELHAQQFLLGLVTLHSGSCTAMDKGATEVTVHDSAPTSAALSLFDASFVEQLSIPEWQALFEAVGFLGGLTADGMTHEKIVVAARGQLPREVLEAVQQLHDLSSEEGAETIFAVARSSGMEVAKWPRNEPPVQRALRLVLAQRSDPKIEQVIRLSQAQVIETGRQRPVREFVGASLRSVAKSPEQIKSDIVNRMRQWIADNDLGSHLEVHVIDNPSELHVMLGRSGRVVRPMVETPEGGRIPLAQRRVQGDMITFEKQPLRLKISAWQTSSLEHYCTLMGEALFDDGNFFARNEHCTLVPLQQRGQAALDDREDPQVVEVKVESLRRRHGEHIEATRGPDCLSYLASQHRRWGEGTLLEARLSIRLMSRRMETRKVTIKVPDQINFRRDHHERTIERYLERVGIRKMASDDRRRDLWTLAPWVHPLVEWRGAFGNDTPSLIEHKILVTTGGSTVPHPDRPDHPEYVHVVDHEGLKIAVSDDAAMLPPRALTFSAQELVRLDVALAARELKDALELQNGDLLRLDETGCFDLGWRRLGTKTVHVVLVARDPQDLRGEIERRFQSYAANGAIPVILVPAGCTCKTAHAEVPLRFPQISYPDLLVAIIRALSLENEVSPLLRAGGRRFVIDAKAGQAWLDKQELIHVSASNHAFDLLAELARCSGEALSSAGLKKKLFPTNDDKIVSKVKLRALNGVEKSFKEAGKDLPPDFKNLIVTARGSIRMAIPAVCFD